MVMKSEMNSLNQNKRRKSGGGEMIKTIGKMLVGFMLMLAVAAGSGYISYRVTSNILRREMADNSNTELVSAKQQEPVRLKDEDAEAYNAVSFDYYIVRLEGENLGVYASGNGREEFLYNEDIFINDLSAGDLELLQKGVTLMNLSELTGFMENFTS